MDSRILHLVSTIESMLSFNHAEHTSYRRFIDSLGSEFKHSSADTMRRDLTKLFDHAMPIVAKRLREAAPEVGNSLTHDGWKGRDKNGYIGSHAHYIETETDKEGKKEWVVQMTELVFSSCFDL
jgi:hypothetical protein